MAHDATHHASSPVTRPVHAEHHTTAKPAHELAMPDQVCGLVEVRQLRREVEALDEFARQHTIREPGKQGVLPRSSKLLEAVANVNGLQLLQAEDRKELVAALEQLERSAPRIHVSFAIEATPAFTAKIVGWLRANIDPRVLLEVGLQPSIAAGCVLRTNNKVFDFSLRQHFAEAQGLLSASLTATTSESTQVAVPEAPHE